MYDFLEILNKSIESPKNNLYVIDSLFIIYLKALHFNFIYSYHGMFNVITKIQINQNSQSSHWYNLQILLFFQYCHINLSSYII